MSWELGEGKPLGFHPHLESNSLLHILGARVSINPQMGWLEPGDITQNTSTFEHFCSNPSHWSLPPARKVPTEMRGPSSENLCHRLET